MPQSKIAGTSVNYMSSLMIMMIDGDMVTCIPSLPGTCYVADMFACKKKYLPYLEVMVWTKLVDRPYVKSRVWV